MINNNCHRVIYNTNTINKEEILICQRNELKQLQAQSKVTSEVVDNTNAQSDLTEAQKGFNMIIVYAGVMLMFFIVINYAGQVAMEIATEKTSRVIEMIITSVSPVTHILAKIFGVIAVALTQIAIFFIVGLISFFVFDIRKMLKGFKIEPNDLTAQLITVGIISLLLGILSYIILAKNSGFDYGKNRRYKPSVNANDITEYDRVLYCTI